MQKEIMSQYSAQQGNQFGNAYPQYAQQDMPGNQFGNSYPQYAQQDIPGNAGTHQFGNAYQP